MWVAVSADPERQADFYRSAVREGRKQPKPTLYGLQNMPRAHTDPNADSRKIRLQSLMWAAAIMHRKQTGNEVQKNDYQAAHRLLDNATMKELRTVGTAFRQSLPGFQINKQRNHTVNEVDVGAEGKRHLAFHPSPSGETVEPARTPAQQLTLRELGMNPKALGTNPRASGTNPRAQQTNPRAQGRHKPSALIRQPQDGTPALQRVVDIYNGSDGDATKQLYADLGQSPAGIIATNLFRAQKNSARAKVYHGGNYHGSYKAQAYARKEWAISNLATVLIDFAECIPIKWGWGIDQNETHARHVLYVETPLGQVSFHTPSRGHGPAFQGQWDGARGMSPERTCRFVAAVLTNKDQPNGGLSETAERTQ